jgi:hypothetical protein
MVHPRTGAPGPRSLAELCSLRGDLERALARLTELRFRLASALYVGKPSGARRVISLDGNESSA